MSVSFETLLPIFLLIALGLVLRWRGIVPEIRHLGKNNFILRGTAGRE